ncbi:MAG: ATP-dependent Clp protease proteolytic subunit [bacterium]|nr:ATP-dependent Clp protease proteolytic subunit [bacterium]
MEPKKKVKARVYGIDHHESHWELQEWHLDIRQFHIYLTGEEIDYFAEDKHRSEPGVEYQMSARFIKNIQILSQIDSKRPILIHMKTCGGDWQEGMAIYDTLWACPNPVTILSYTHARSMSSIILQAADKRVLMPNSYFMIHEGTLGLEGTTKVVHSMLDYDKRVVRPTMLNIYVEKLKQKGKFSRRAPERIKEMLQEEMNKKEDVYLTPQEAVEWGFADEVFDRNWVALTKFSRKFKKL